MDPPARCHGQPGGNRLFFGYHARRFPWLRVECHAGHCGEEIPRRFCIGIRSPLNGAVLSFLVFLRHDMASERWALTLFDARGLKGE
ncbi:MAG TPA: hypothetical protein EYP40_02415 [Chromatiales bacterium]|nr:hypothetical protein [Chromatiales bacterium]